MPPVARPGPLRRHLRLLLAAPLLLGLVLSAVFCERLAPQDPFRIDTRNILASPSAAHLLGTDELGRDILSRILYGARVSLTVAASAVLIAALVGIPIGLVASYLGGRVENLAMRAIDIFVCLPEIFVAIFVIAFLQHGLGTLVWTIGLLYFPQFARVTYSVTSSIKHREYVLAAIGLGAGRTRVICYTILPNIVSIIVVQVSFTLSFAMLLEAGLSFLGLGIPPPQPSWGQMVGSLKDYLLNNPWPVVFPSLALFLAIFSVNTLGDWLQDYLNPEIAR